MYGQTIKQIRKMKGFTQKEIYTNVVSKSFYSDFEAGKYAISVDKFEGLLQNLNISFEEFYYFQHQLTLTDSKQLEQEIDALYGKGKFEELFAIFEEHHKSTHKELRFLASKAYLMVLLTQQNFYQLSREPFNEIIAELELTKSWTINEIKLAKLVLLSMSEKKLEQGKKLFEKIQIELDKYQNFDNEIYEKELTDLFFNRIQSLLVLNDISGAKAIMANYSAALNGSEDLGLFVQFKFMEILVGLYTNYPVFSEKATYFLQQVKDIPISECHFYKIIFQIHNEKAKNYFSRYFG